MRTMKTMISVIALSAIAGTAAAADFTALDANGDGQVDFAEYSAAAKAEGKTKTLAAQEFTRMAQGDAILTEDEYNMAIMFVDQPYALQNTGVVSEPMPFEPTENVTPVETFESLPQEVEMFEPPVVEEAPIMEDAPIVEVQPITPETDLMIEPPAPVITETPVESDSAVAGEVVTSDDWIDTPVEEGLSDLPDADAEIDIETDIESEPDIDDTLDEDAETAANPNGDIY